MGLEKDVVDIDNTINALDELLKYRNLMIEALSFIVVAMLVIYALQKLTAKLLYPYIKRKRIIKVIFGTLYTLIFVVTILLVLKKLGFEIEVMAKVSILSVLALSVAIFFLLPFLPRLPFKVGHTVEIGGIMGSVDNISTYHTTIRKFDGTMVFIPNTTIFGSQIINYSDTPNRRATLNLTLTSSSDIEIAKAEIQSLLDKETRIIKDPEPSLLLTNIDASGLTLTTYYWTSNADFFDTVSDVLQNVEKLFATHNEIEMARVGQDIYFKGKK
jgi:small conductance mechanosensitive channel